MEQWHSLWRVHHLFILFPIIRSFPSVCLARLQKKQENELLFLLFSLKRVWIDSPKAQNYFKSTNGKQTQTVLFQTQTSRIISNSNCVYCNWYKNMQRFNEIFYKIDSVCFMRTGILKISYDVYLLSLHRLFRYIFVQFIEECVAGENTKLCWRKRKSTMNNVHYFSLR